MFGLNKLAGIAAVLEGVIYIAAFFYFGAVWDYPADGLPAEKMRYLADNQLAFSIVSGAIYLLFGVLLAVLVAGLHERFKRSNHPLLPIASLFGAVWVGLIIASGMIANIGLDYSLSAMHSNPEKAHDMWVIFSVINESLGGGNELVGGLWVLLISVAAMRDAQLPRGLNYLGYIVGAAGVATIVPVAIFAEIFGLTQIVWFLWLGVYLLRAEPKA